MGRLCTGHVYEEKISPVLEPHNSVCPRFCQEPDPSRVGPLGVGRGGGMGQVYRKVGGMAPTPKLHNSVTAQISTH